MSAIAHIVMWHLNGATPLARQQQAQQVVQAFEALRGQVPGLLQLEVGASLPDDEAAHDVAVYSVFESIEALNRYNEHPAHLQIKQLMGPMRAARNHIDFQLPSAGRTKP